MTQFASVYRDDAEPSCPYYQNTGDRTCKSGCWDEPRCITGMPLDGWLKPQHNPPNPILTTLRLNCDTPEEDGFTAPIAATYFLHIGIDNVEPEQASPEHIEHARKVLERLARLIKEEK